MQYVVLLILAIITQIIVSWAGSQLHSIGTEEIHYAVFTFSDDRELPMSTNIFINIFVPNVILFLIELFVKEYGIQCVEDSLIFYVVFFYGFRYILICCILRRKELYNFIYELTLAFVGIGIAYFLIHFFFSSQETIIITASELREELWFVVIIILYKFFKLILDRYVRQDTILTKSQINRYIINKFNLFYKRYNDLLDVSYKNRYLCIFTYAVMIFEDYNRGPFVRKMENLLCKLKHKEMTLGIMQVHSKESLSDKESIAKFYQQLLRSPDEQLLEGNPRNQAWTYNNDESYAEQVTYIFEALCTYIDEIPRYRKEFCTRQTIDDSELLFNKKVEKLGKLHVEGIITEIEFEEEKRKLIEEIHNI